MVSTDVLKVLSEIIGYCYTFMWGISNWPQFFLNYRRKSVAGYSMAFQMLNTLGFTCYSIYTFVGFFYQRAHHLTRSIVLQDVLFAASTTFIVYALSVQAIIYRSTATGTIHPFYKLVVVVISTLCIYNCCLSLTHKLEWFSHSDSASAFSTIHVFGYCKSAISLIKYVPQVHLNWKNQNTRGFAIPNVLLDLGGGLFSFLQMFINAYIDKKPNGDPDFSNITSNIPKLLLSIESMGFCVIFITQHYILYRANNKRIELDEKMRRDQGLVITDNYENQASLLDSDENSVNAYKPFDY